jgi:tRNA 2-thiouridine synthesizing protein A
MVLCLISTDPAARIDVPHFCNEAGHSLIATCETGDSRRYYIRKA